MNILVTGSNGFIGKNLVNSLKNYKNYKILEFNKTSTEEELDYKTKICDFVFHLAGANRPKKDEEYLKVNFGLTKKLLHYLKKNNNFCSIMFASSKHSEKDTLYGKSKLEAENLLLEYSKKNSINTYIYRFPNIFGKWSKPNYNSVVATFAHNIANDLPIKIFNKEEIINLVYIDDVINELKNAIVGKENRKGEYCYVSPVYTLKIDKIAKILYSFKKINENHDNVFLGNPIEKKLFSTYLSYIPKDNLKYELKMNKDLRGSFSEFIRSKKEGQISVNITKPGVLKGNHWHHSKNEKFLVVSGKGLIRLRDINKDEIIEYVVSEKKLEVVLIPPGYSHNIENIGKKDLVTIMWANETFSKINPDTYYMEV